MPGAGFSYLSAASFLHLHVCLDGTATPSGASILVTRQTKGLALTEMSYATLNTKHFLQHTAVRNCASSNNTFHAFWTGEREALTGRPGEACLQTYLKFTLDTAQVLGFAASLCIAGSQERQATRLSPRQVLLEPAHCRLSPKWQFLAWLLRWKEETAD